MDDPEPEALLRRFEAEADLFGHAYDRCAERAEQAITLADRRGLVPVGIMARVIAARCSQKLGQLDVAIRRASEAGDLMEEQLHAVQGELARQRLGFEALQLYRLLFTLQAERKAPSRVADAFVTSERARARAHLDAVVRSQVAQFSNTLPVSPVKKSRSPMLTGALDPDVGMGVIQTMPCVSYSLVKSP